MHKSESKNIVAVLSDLMFTVKIQDAARRAGLESVFVSNEQDTLRLAAGQPALIILDLNMNAVEPLRLIERLKGDAATRGIPLLGFVSHVQTDLRSAAERQGCDTVLARSAFSQNLSAILARYAPPASHAEQKEEIKQKDGGPH